MKILSFWFGMISILFSLFPSLAIADESHVDARLLCNKNEALLQFASGPKKEVIFPELPVVFANMFTNTVDQTDFECNLGSDDRPRSIRVKIGVIRGKHFGTCGGATKYFFSMWIDKRKVLSRRFFRNPCAQFDDLEMVYYTDTTLLLCTRPNAGRNIYEQMQSFDNSQLACINNKETYVDAIQGPIDVIEYPPNGSRRREGHVVTIRTENPELCSYLHNEFSAGKDFYNVFDRYHDQNDSEPLEFSAAPMTKTGPFIADINNDKRPDYIAVREYGSGSSGRELVLLMDGRNEGRISVPTAPIRGKFLTSHSPLIPIEETVFGQNTIFRATPYILMRPFDWNGTIYILMASVYDIKPPEWAVYVIASDYSFQEVCVLDQIPINY